MEWETIGLILAIIGYLYLLKKIKFNSVSGKVYLFVEPNNKDKKSTLPKGQVFIKQCDFIITPVPGMGYRPEDITFHVAEITSVIIEEYAGMEVTCLLDSWNDEIEFDDACVRLQNCGWHKLNT